MISQTPASAPLPFATAYQQALLDFIIAGAGEQALMQAYDLGRRAVTEQLNILDLVAMHQNFMARTVLSGATRDQMSTYLRQSEEFLAEVMAPFEMMHRGFVDTIRQLQEVNASLEQRVDERTRDLQASQRKTTDLARLYLILSNINSAIVRLRDRQELFKEACRIAVAQGGYQVAWVNLRDTDGPESTDTWCHLADHGSACQSTPVDTLSMEIDRSMTEVYREGRPLVRHRDDDDLAIWNGSAIGYSAYALLPLLQDERTIGVFALFSAEAGSFNADEMRLLVEMAGDLAFALDHIRKQEQINYFAYYDQLTGLPNRALLLERLALQLQAAKRDGAIVALLLVDLVRFSDVNDTSGRHVGDILLKQVGGRLCEATGNCETVARLGADHFAMSFSHIVDTNQVAHRLEQGVFDSFKAPFLVDGSQIHLAAQVGISLFPTDGSDADTLYKHAEIALKRAQTKNEPYLFYDPAMNERIVRSVTMEAKLRKAIAQDELVVYYQPKVSAANGRIVGLEALLRYTDPESGIVLPSRFIPLLEETGMIIEIGSWAMRRAVEDIRHWRRLNLDPPRVAVNVSPIQLRQKNFVQSLRDILQDNGGRSDGLDMEITESAVMDDVKENIPKLEAVREMGFRIAIDDFGTGYSSLSYLSQLPLNELKIDRSFIVEMTERPNSLSIVTAIISLAHSLGLEVVAEGVDLEEQAKLLRLLRCDLIQGNLYSPPLAPEGIITLLRQKQG